MGFLFKMISEIISTWVSIWLWLCMLMWLVIQYSLCTSDKMIVKPVSTHARTKRSDFKHKSTKWTANTILSTHKIRNVRHAHNDLKITKINFRNFLYQPVGSCTVCPMFCRIFAGITPFGARIICPFGVINVGCWPIWMPWPPICWPPIFGINMASWPSTVTDCIGCTTENIPLPACCSIWPPWKMSLGFLDWNRRTRMRSWSLRSNKKTNF